MVHNNFEHNRLCNLGEFSFLYNWEDTSVCLVETQNHGRHLTEKTIFRESVTEGRIGYSRLPCDCVVWIFASLKGDRKVMEYRIIAVWAWNGLTCKMQPDLPTWIADHMYGSSDAGSCKACIKKTLIAFGR